MSIDPSFAQALARRKAEVDRLLEKSLAPYHPLTQPLEEAMAYSLLAGGKRLRPILCLETMALFSKDPALAYPAAVALEMFHTFSLIHDDLPCMDDDDLRRGKETCHKRYGQAAALLAGDALIFEGYDLLSAPQPGLSADQQLAALQAAALALGRRGMTGGQMADLGAESSQADPETLSFIHRHKTGALLSLSVDLGAIYAGAKGKDRALLSDYAAKLGLAFQIVDDILDLTSRPEDLGKSVGKDAAQEKMTYPALYGLEASREMAQAVLEEARALLSGLDHLQTDFFRDFTDYLGQRTR